MDLNKIFINTLKGRKTLDQYIANLNLMNPYPRAVFNIDLETHQDKETLNKYKEEISKRVKDCSL